MKTHELFLYFSYNNRVVLIRSEISLYQIILLYLRFLINFIECIVNKVNFLNFPYHFNNIFNLLIK